MNANYLRKGYVYVQNNFAGIIAETDEGYVFSYDKDYIKKDNSLPVSLTLPIKTEEYFSNILFPFFDGLIPEGWLLNIASRNWKIDIQDRFGLLLAVCKDCIGDVCVKNGEEL